MLFFYFGEKMNLARNKLIAAAAVLVICAAVLSSVSPAFGWLEGGNRLISETNFRDLNGVVAVGTDKGALNPVVAPDINNWVHVAWNYLFRYTQPETGGITYSRDEVYYCRHYLNNAYEYNKTYFAPYERHQRDITMALDSNRYLHYVWRSDRDEDFSQWNLYYIRRTPGGGWQGFTKVTSSAANEVNPQIEVGPGNVIHLIWHENSGGRNRVFYKKKPTAFGDWEEGNGTVISDSPSNAHNASMAIDSDGNIHVVWEDQRGSSTEIFYRKIDGSTGMPIGIGRQISDDGYSSLRPSITVDTEKNIHVVWQDYKYAGRVELFYTKCSAGGMWDDTTTRLTTYNSESTTPNIVSDSFNNLYVVFVDTRYDTVYNNTNNEQVWFKMYHAQTEAWLPEEMVSKKPSGSPAYDPSVKVDGTSVVHVVWTDKRDSGQRMVYYDRADKMPPISTIEMNDFYKETNWQNGLTWAENSIKGTSSDNCNAIKEMKIRISKDSGTLYWDGASWQGTATWLNVTELNETTGEWFYNGLSVSDLEEETMYLVESRATDMEDNVQIMYGTKEFGYDNLEPLGQTVFENTWFGPESWTGADIKGTAADNLAGVASVEVSIERQDTKYWNGTSWGATEIFLPTQLEADRTNWAFVLDASLEADFFATTPNQRTYSIRMKVTDRAGNTNTFTPADNYFMWDETKPVSSMTQLPPNRNNLTAFEIEWSGNDSESSIKNYDVEYKFNDGGWEPLLSETTDTTNQFNPIWNDGTYSFRCRARDNALNVEDWPADYDTRTTIDTSKPEATLDMSQSLYGTWTWGSTTIRGDASDTGTGVTKVFVTIQRTDTEPDLFWNGSTWEITPVSLEASLTDPGAQETAWSYNLSVEALTDAASYIIKAVAVDGFGYWQTSPAQRLFDFDGQDPVAIITQPTASTVHTGAISINGTATDTRPNMSYTLSYKNPSTPYIEFYSAGSQVPSGLLGTLDPVALGLPDNPLYTIELKAEDEAGNIATATVSITIDVNPPSTEYTLLPDSRNDDGWYTANVVMTLSPEDNGTGVSSTWYRYKIDGGSWGSWIEGTNHTFTNNGEYIVEYYSTDNSGHTETTKSVSFKRCDDWPATPVVNYVSPTDEATQKISGTVAASDRVFVNGVEVAVSGTSWEKTVDLLNEGNNQFVIEVMNTASNSSSRTIYIFKDTIAPETAFNIISGTAGENGWYTSVITAQLNPTDPSPGWGVETVYYAVNGNESSSNSWPVTVYLTREGENTLSYYSVDKLGNTETTTEMTINIDTVAPQAPTVIYPEITTQDNVLLTGTTEADTTIVINDSINVIPSGTSWGKQVDVPLQGENHINIKAKDEAGNYSEVNIIVIRDSEGPLTLCQLTGTPGKNGWFISDVTVTMHAEDALSDVAETVYNINGMTYTKYEWPIEFTVNYEGIHQLSYYSRDSLGTKEQPTKFVTIKIDKRPPFQPQVNFNKFTNEPIQTLTGWADISADLYINGVTVEVDGFGNWSYDITLEQGDNNIQLYSEDEAGNSSVRNILIVYDNVPPFNCEITLNDGAIFTSTTEVQVKLSGEDGVSTIESYRLSNDGINYSSKKTFRTDPFTWRLTAGEDGERTVYAIFYDEAGSTSEVICDTIILDQTQPDLSATEIVINSENLTNSTDAPGINDMVINPYPSLDIAINGAVDPEPGNGFPASGISHYTLEFVSWLGKKSYTFSNSDSTFTVSDAKKMTSGYYSLKVTIHDVAGNKTSVEFDMIYVSGSVPQVMSEVIPLPCPYNPLSGEDMKIQFTPSGDINARIGLYIHDTAGRLLWKEVKTVNELFVNKGFMWDGKTQYGRFAENGVLMLRIVDESEKRLIGKAKIVIIKNK